MRLVRCAPFLSLIFLASFSASVFGFDFGAGLSSMGQSMSNTAAIMAIQQQQHDLEMQQMQEQQRAFEAQQQKLQAQQQQLQAQQQQLEAQRQEMDRVQQAQSAAIQATKNEAEMAHLVVTYPNWKKIVGAVADIKDADPKNPFRKWLKNKSADYQALVEGTQSARELETAITTFRSEVKTAKIRSAHADIR
jgi:TolA-binding protein